MDFLHQVAPVLTGTEAAALKEYLDSGGWLTEFRQTQLFETMLAEYVGVGHCTVVTSGTVALYCALLAAGVGPGDTVLVPNYTMIATPNAVAWTGATPALVDVEPDTLCLDLGAVAPDVKAAAMLYVPINGRCGDMDAVVRFCRERGMVLIEDACQALGSNWRGRRLGSFGQAGAYSFTPHKIITTGQGGAVATDDDAFAARLAKVKDFHRTAPATDEHDGLGFNFKFTDLQAVVGIEQLKDIAARVERKKAIYGWFREMLDPVAAVEMLPTNLEDTAPWFVDVLLPSARDRDALRGHLKARGIGSRPFYPPVNHQPMYAAAHGAGSLPVSEGLAVRGLWLPSSLDLTREQAGRVCLAIEEFFTGGGR
ncbi:DegT/DnrJ/EryC1/StrS family aminotransferase [Solidesulfovibrio sp.]|uniref:DegT/DnrJ/EryC1/StrS family aminotransferase n=1 Tax=Solidesulfovibrio sp. TaxID=2910990 RepID=UPI00261F019E|nr:DegT/DnrJ/EryC1/StrS family aminotransferase [Solidesulfovibrio sp.]